MKIVSRCEHRAAVCFCEKQSPARNQKKTKIGQIGKVWPALFFCPEIETAAQQQQNERIRASEKTVRVTSRIDFD